MIELIHSTSYNHDWIKFKEMETGDMFKPAPPDAQPEPIPFLVTSSGQGNSPGPAEYGKHNDILSNVPKLHLHSKHESKTDVNQAPYRNIGSSIGTGHKYTIKGKYNETIESTPGCDYAPESFGKSGNFVYVHTKPTEKEPEITPGPADYANATSIGKNVPKYTFHGPKGDRLFRSVSDTPGPANYDQRTQSNSPKVSIGHKYTSKSIEETPGPASYSDKTGLLSPNRNRGLIGSKISNKQNDGLMPGPADYGVQSPILKNVPRLFMHGKSVEKRDVNNAGYQNTRGQISNGEKGAASSATKQYSLRSRYNIPDKDSTPGVDYVPPPFGSSSIKCSISPRYTNLRNSDNSPGPGKYNTESIFGKNARKSILHNGRSYSKSPEPSSPGPADYGTDYYLPKSNSPRYTIKSGRYDPQKDKTGEYVNLGSTLKGPKYSLGRKPSVSCSYS